MTMMFRCCALAERLANSARGKRIDVALKKITSPGGAYIPSLIGTAWSDGPPLFWKVSCMRISAPFESRERFFGTKEAALDLHGLCAAALARGHTGVTCL
jgi:hypothetical protein